MTDDKYLISIIQDHTSMQAALYMIADAIESKNLPDQAYLPCFNDQDIEAVVTLCLELATGKKYD
jgi:hypothetical protein